MGQRNHFENKSYIRDDDVASCSVGFTKQKKRMPYLAYAEDDADDQQDMKRLLADIDPNIQLKIFGNGLELVQFLSSLKADEERPEIIFLDVNMPIWDGVRTLQALKSDAQFNGIPVIMWSTSTLQRDIDLAHRLGAAAFVTKPTQQDEWTNVKNQLSRWLRPQAVQGEIR